MTHPSLLGFIKDGMSMTDVYQPVIIRELLLNGGERSKSELATAIAAYDATIAKHYERVVMRYPKSTLSKHGIVEYARSNKRFRLVLIPSNENERYEAIKLCESKVELWLETRKKNDKTGAIKSSVRYEVLRDARGKCLLCGISSQIRPIDVDHIVPRSKADKRGNVTLKGQVVGLNDRRNLQALCATCNRAKRDGDETDFRSTGSLLRDRESRLVHDQESKAEIRALTDIRLSIALRDKLAEEHANLLVANNFSEKSDALAEMAETIFSIAETLGSSEEDIMRLVLEKRDALGRFRDGLFLAAP